MTGAQKVEPVCQGIRAEKATENREGVSLPLRCGVNVEGA